MIALNYHETISKNHFKKVSRSNIFDINALRVWSCSNYERISTSKNYTIVCLKLNGEFTTLFINYSTKSLYFHTHFTLINLFNIK
jgi:hypothetical protein